MDSDLRLLDDLEQSFAQDFEPAKIDEPESNIENIINADALFDASKSSEKGTLWKHSVQKYELNLLINIRRMQHAIRTGKYKPIEPREFILKERGKNRVIKSHDISDRVLQKSLNDNVLLPAVVNKLIYDNGASQIHKGLSFSRERFEKHMIHARKKYGRECVCLIADFSKYFDNIVHSILINQLSSVLSTGELELVKTCLKQFEVDVSYMSDEEYDSCIDTVFNTLEYTKPEPGKYETTKIMCKSVGIGSQLSQIAGIYYPHEIDNYFKIVKSVKYYGRYMDDIYMFLPDMKTAKEYRTLLLDLCDILKIHLNEKKTRLVRINTQISYLKITYSFKEPTGKLIRRINSKTIGREKRRLMKFLNLYKKGMMNLYDILLCYRTWRYSYSKYDSKIAIHALDKFMLMNFPQLHKDYLKRKTKMKDLEWLKHATYNPRA